MQPWMTLVDAASGGVEAAIRAQLQGGPLDLDKCPDCSIMRLHFHNILHSHHVRFYCSPR
jgi:hypothetical protein